MVGDGRTNGGIGLAGMGFAVIVHEGSTLVVIGNALRLLTFRGELGK